MKKVLSVAGVCCLLIIIVVGIYLSIPPKTVDFRGVVYEIENVDGYTTLYLENAVGAKYAVKTDIKTTVSYCCDDDPAIELTEISVGDSVDGDYRRFSKNLAKYITVEYHKQ